MCDVVIISESVLGLCWLLHKQLPLLLPPPPSIGHRTEKNTVMLVG